MDKLFWIILCLNAAVLVKTETECKTVADIIFMVDSSTSIREFQTDDNRDNWQIIKTFIVNITKQLPIREDAIRIGVVKFATEVDKENIIYLGSYSSKEELQSKINGLTFLGGGTNTAGAIRNMYSGQGMFGQSGRSYAQKFGILITDGLSNIESNKTKPEARIARLTHNIKIFTLGITKYANVDELQEIASDPVSHYHFLSKDFAHLNLLIDDILLGLCREKPPPSAPCVDGRADVTFILDASGSIGMDNWIILKQFVLAVVESLDLASGSTRVAIVRYSTEAEIIFPFNKYFGSNPVGTLADMREEILGMQHVDDRTNIAAALRITREQVYTEQMGDRPDIKDIGILISDGFPTDEVNGTKIESALMHQAGITMFALGLTNQIDEHELKDIASKPTVDHYLNTTSIADVGSLKSRLIWGVCSDKCADSTTFNPECWRNISSFGCKEGELPRWIHHAGHILLGHNYERLENIPTPEDCQRLCFRDPQCRSVDYVTRYRQCAVSYVTKDDAPASFVRENSADYYELSCSTFSQGPTAPPVLAPGSGSGSGTSGGGPIGGSGGSGGGAGASSQGTRVHMSPILLLILLFVVVLHVQHL